MICLILLQQFLTEQRGKSSQLCAAFSGYYVTLLCSNYDIAAGKKASREISIWLRKWDGKIIRKL